MTAIYTDGSFSKQRNSAGAGAWFGIDDDRTLSRKVPFATNIIEAEFCAIIYALEKTIMNEQCIVYTDSQPVFRMLTTHKEKQSSQKYKTYIDLVEKLKQNRDISFIWIPGHSKNYGNMQADKLAKKAMKDV